MWAGVGYPGLFLAPLNEALDSCSCDLTESKSHSSHNGREAKGPVVREKGAETSALAKGLPLGT